MAEGVFKRLVEEYGLENEFEIDSAGLISVHQGEMPDARMCYHASRRGYELSHLSRPVTAADFDNFDMLIGMDENNITGLVSIARSDKERSKIHRMVSFSQYMNPDFIPDPYYGGSQGFENVIDMLEDACAGLLKYLTSDAQ